MATVAGKTTAPRDSSHSGRLLLRMPRALHAQLAARSDADGVSLNQYIVSTLTRSLSGEREGEPARRGVPRSIRLALIVNAVVVAVAAATCVVLLYVAWH
jgi:hypothetical protein